MSTRRFPGSLAVVVVIVALVAGCSPNPAPTPSTADVQALVATLTSDESAQARADAATTLGRIGADGGPGSTAAAEAVDHLAVALGDKAPAVRAAAATGLGGLALGPGVMPLLTALDDDAAEVRDAAQSGLATLLEDLDDQDAADRLIDALDHESATVRAAAADGLKGVGQVAAIAPLLALLADPATNVKDAASATLDHLVTRLPAGDVEGAFLTALDDQDASVRAGAATRLGDVGKASAVMPLLECLDDPAAEVKGAATSGLSALLARLDDTTAITELLDATKSDSTPVQKGANTALRTFLASLGPEPAAMAVTAAGAGDTWLAVALGVPRSRIAAEARRLGIQLEPIEGIRSAAAVARSGHRVSGSHKYTSSSAFHPAVLFASSDFPAGTVERWSPTALRFLELVVTEKITWKRLEVCKYYGPDITRYRAVMTIKVISAATGKVVATKTYTGPAPRRCRQTEPYSLTVLRGSEPSLSPAIKWLRGIIHPPV